MEDNYKNIPTLKGREGWGGGEINVNIISFQACTGMEEVMETQPLKRWMMAFRVTSPEWWVRGRPSFTHSSYLSSVDTMSLKSGLFDGFADQQRFIRWASAGWQLAGSGGLSFCSIIQNNSTLIPLHFSKYYKNKIDTIIHINLQALLPLCFKGVR